MSEPASKPCVLLVADPDRLAELVAALSEPLQQGEIELVNSSGGDDTIDLYEARRPLVVVVTASLEAGDSKSLIDAMREISPRAQVSIVVVGDDLGPIRTALDAMELGPDRFVTRPLASKALRYAVSSGLDAVSLVRGPDDGLDAGPGRGSTLLGPGMKPVAPGSTNGVAHIDDAPTTSTRSAMRARWEALADSMVEWPEGDPDEKSGPMPVPPPPPIIIKPRRRTEPVDEISPPQAWRPGNTDPMVDASDASGAPQREPTLIIREPALAAPLPQLPPRLSSPSVPPPFHTLPLVQLPRVTTTSWPPPMSPHDADSVVLAERGADDVWSEPVMIPELSDRDSKRDLTARTSTEDDLDAIDAMDDSLDDSIDDSLDDFADDSLGLGGEPSLTASEGRLAILNDLTAEVHPSSAAAARPGGTLGRLFSPNGGGRDVPLLPDEPATVAADGRDFARQLRAKMSMMAQRLFQQSGDAASSQVDLAPRHDHHTEIDLSVVGEETPLGGGNTEIESRASSRGSSERELTTSPGSWDTQVRERGLPDAGELVRGTSDAALLLAKTFATQTTCHIKFKQGDVEKIVYFDLGRPVFAASSEPLDRMGELLVREGKITASQYERCQAVVAESGRRMGEILVDFGYLKRRELLPAVRRHVEDILYSLFGWEHGHYQIVVDPMPSAERIRLSRHPAALILEGIRRKLGRSTLERLVGPASTVIEVPDRDRLGGIINLSDLTVEERAALAALDGQADLAAVARLVGVDVADLLPFAWGLCALGLASARRTDTEVPDESTALVGETDLAIDRERVRARWALVTDADYFALLGVRRDATAFEIRRAYQAARRDFASDCFPSDLRRELAQELDDIANVLDEAFRVLRDDRLRLTYLTNLFE